MARLPRLAIDGEVHLVLHSGHNRQPVFADDEDRRLFLVCLQDARVRERVAIHGYALLPDHVWVLATPFESRGLGRMMQVVGRRFANAFNRRHARTGTLWDGRFRSTVVAGEAAVVEAMIFVEQSPVRAGLASRAVDYEWSSARHHAAQSIDAMLTDPAAYWSMGNTPFERAAAYSSLLAEPMTEDRAKQVLAATKGGWALASEADISVLQKRTTRPLVARPRGRPPSTGAVNPSTVSLFTQAVDKSRR